jgi:sirohydrochlorin cobaltochelatase
LRQTRATRKYSEPFIASRVMKGLFVFLIIWRKMMKFPLAALALTLLMLPGAALAAGANDKALMLTVFGTSTEATVTFEELLPLVQQRFPDRTVVVPYTSSIIRNKLNAEIADPAQKILSPAQMLEKLKAEGYKDIAVVSTLLFAGVEHDNLKSTVEEFGAANHGLKVSYVPPLLSVPANLKPAVDTLRPYLLADGSNIVVAHGTHAGHPVEQTYLELAKLVAAAYPNARVGSIEGVPDMEETLDWVKGRKDKNVRFVVFMFVAGDHAENDIASDEEDSLFTAVREMDKTPSVRMVETKNGRRIASLGLDANYRKLLLEHYGKNVPN